MSTRTAHAPRVRPTPAVSPSVPPLPTARQVAGGVGALGVLLVGLVGIPAVLSATIGWPLPHHVPTGAQAAHAFGSTIPDSFWPRLFATLAWVAWAYFAFSVGASLFAQLRGRRPGRRRLLVGSGATAALVAAVLLLGQLRGPSVGTQSVHVGAPASRAPVVQLMAETTPVLTPVSADQSLVSQATTAPATVIHTVLEGDTLWSIAVQYYGDGEQWEAIYQANVGVSQPGGGVLSDAHWIYPGWTLTIPAATQASPAVPATTPAPVPAASSSTPEVGAPDAGTPGSTSTTTSATASGQDHRATTSDQGTRRNVPKAHGTERHRPSTTGSVPERLVPAAASTGTNSRRPLALHSGGGAVGRHTAKTSGKAKVRPAAPHAAGSEVGPIAVGAGLFGLSAIGLVAALDRRRRRQLGRRSVGGHIPRPAPRSPLADLELQLRHYARADHGFWVCHLPELLGQAAASLDVPSPVVEGVELVDDGLDVLVTDAGPEVPQPFVSRNDRPGVWHLPLVTDPRVVDQAAGATPLPLALATVGRTATGAVLVNADRFHSVHITVPADEVEGVLAAMATELAATTAPTGTAVVAVGFGYGMVDRLDGGVVVDDLDEVAALLRPGQPAVVLVDPGAGTDPVLGEVSGTAGVHLVTAGPTAPVDAEVVLDPERPSLGDHVVAPVRPGSVGDDQLEEVETLFELAEEVPEAPSEADGKSTEQVPPSAPTLEGEVVIGLLGEPTFAVGDGPHQDLVSAVGSTAGTKARRVAELLVYLAAHGGTATRGEWLTDISPDKALSDGYVRNLVLLTRRSLEALTGDSDLLAYDRSTQRFSLGERVTSDWKQFQSATTDGGPPELHRALGLVRGAPFGVDPDPWTSAGGLSYVFGDAVTDAALTLGQSALDEGDSRLATWAVRQGQLVNRYDQGLWRLLLRAAPGDAAREQVWRELHALLAVDGDPSDDLEPATVELYRSLVGCTQPAEIVVLQDEDDAVLPTRRAV